MAGRRTLGGFIDCHDILQARRCRRALWLSQRAPGCGAPLPDGIRYRREQSRRVAAVVRARYPAGVVLTGMDATAAARETRRLLAEGADAVFGATFVADGCAAVADLALRDAGGGHRLVEIKASKGVRPSRHDPELAALWLVATAAGMPPSGADVLHLEPGHRQGADRDLLRRVDRTDAVRSLLPTMTAAQAALHAVLAGEREPAVAPGPQCRDDRGDLCRFWRHCSAALARPSVFDLPGLRWERRWELARAGRAGLAELQPGDLPAGMAHLVGAHLSGETWIDRPGLRATLADWRHPLLHLDFECWSPSLPVIPGTRPFERLPVQFSAHVEPAPGAEPDHWEHLHQTRDDPRPVVAAALASVLRRFPAATLVAYHAEFERRCLGILAEAATPADAADLRRARARVRDPQLAVRRHVYAPAFQGSYSIKTVAPVLLGDAFGYDRLAVADGEAAMARYEDLLAEGDPQARAAIADELRAYCRQDTWAMLHLVRWLCAAAAPVGP